VDDFVVAVEEGDVLGLVAEALDGAARLGSSEIAAVVVAHLEEDEVAGLHLGEDLVPRAFVDESAAAAAGVGAVGDVDTGGVEVVGEVVAPAEVGLVAGGRVADDEDGGEFGVEGRVCGDVGLWGRVRGGVCRGLRGDDAGR
jgi:hypothetical protein